MNPTPHNDRLEEFFRQSLENLPPSPEPDGWDLPSDRVWEGIQAHLDGAKRRPAALWWIWGAAAAALLLLATFFFLWSTHRRLDTLSRTVEDNRLRIEQLQQALEEAQKPLPPTPAHSDAEIAREKPT
ncbi:MAG: hypothetical protein D6765_03875, partial [Bacteroidetes bacterium]